MAKPNTDDSQLFDRTSSPSPMPQPPPPPPPPPPPDFDVNWQTSLSQSEPSIQSRQQRFPPINGYHSSSYKVSIGHETVNITEMTRDRNAMMIAEKRRLTNSRKSANILSLCFMCFVSASLILIAISTIHLISKTSHTNDNNLVPHLIPTTNLTSGFLYMLSVSESVSNLLLPSYDRTIRELAIVICLLIIVFNCFCVLIFSIEIYLGANMIKYRYDVSRTFRYLFSSSTARFIAICSFYASIPAFMLVMCLFILLNLSLMPAIISLVILGFGLIFILLTLLTYFSVWQTNQIDGGLNSSIYHTVDATHVCDDEIDLTKTDELSTLV